MSEALEEVREAEERLRIAMLTSDVSALGNLLDDDLIFTNHLGQRIDRNMDLAAHRSGSLTLSAIELSDQKILIKGGCIAVVSVKATIEGTYAGEPAGGDFVFTRIWAKESGNWRVIAAHSGTIA